jgi:predicted CXXCH cytochrome family protein
MGGIALTTAQQIVGHGPTFRTKEKRLGCSAGARALACVAMPLLLVFLAALTLPPARVSFAQTVDLPEDYSCFLCHRKEGDLWNENTPIADEEHLAEDIHWQKGLRCHDCHGGAPTLDEFKNHRNDPEFRSLQNRQDVPAFCGHCHSNREYMRRYNPSVRVDQEEHYWGSGHGQRLKSSSQGENAVADQDVATCIDCHGRHGILAANKVRSPVYRTHIAETCAKCHADPEKMAGRTYHDRPIGSDQYDQWRQSVHGIAMLEKGDLSAPTCSNCHGHHGALPPGVDSVANACGNCHGKIAKLFSETAMKHKFQQVGLPGCATCHGEHAVTQPDDKMLGMQEAAVCAQCHNAENPQYGATVAGADAARAMRARLEELKDEIAQAEEMIRQADRLGMEVRGPKYDLRQAFEALTNARTLVHSFKPGPTDEALDEGLQVTAQVKEAAGAALQEHTNRRVWLAASLVPIFLVVALLLIFIRRLPVPDSDELHQGAGGESA